MGCRPSKNSQAPTNGVVSVRGDRKRLAKAAVEKRKAFAEAHCQYFASLSAVSSAIGAFVARFPHTSLPEISLPLSGHRNSVGSNRDQTCAQTSPSDSMSVASESSYDEGGEIRDVCEHFYGDDRPLMSSPERRIGWDFFNLLDNPLPPPPPPARAAISKKKKEKLGVRKKEIDKNATSDLEVKVKSSDEACNGRELLVALKDLEQHFATAYESGQAVSRMLEVNKPQLQPLMEDLKEKSGKFNKANTWNRSPSQSSSCKSLISWSSKSSSTWTDSRTELFDANGGMESGSHSFTLGRLYAWEKKFYDELKAAEQTMKSYRQKCSQMKKPQSVAKDKFSPSKETAEVTYLYNRILVSRRSVESISKQIEKLRDEELQPQLVELLHGLMRTWKIMSESHQTQNKIISGVKAFNSQMDEKLCNESHRLVTLQLEKELRNWQSCFLNYIFTQKSYVACLCGWLSKLIDSNSVNHPTLLVACQTWLTSLENLPEKAVKFSMKALVKDVHDLWVQQGEEQEAKKKVDGLVKEIDRKASKVKKEEGKVLLLKPSVEKFLVRNSAEDFSGKKNMLDLLRMRVESERVKYQSSVERTEAATLNGLKMGFSSVFESLTDFSRASAKLYADVVTFCENSQAGH